jgi:hypothetical protein
MNERTNKRMDEQISTWTNKRTNKWTNKETNKQTNERTNKRTNERTNEPMNGWSNERMKNEQWTNEHTTNRMNPTTRLVVASKTLAPSSWLWSLSPLSMLLSLSEWPPPLMYYWIHYCPSTEYWLEIVCDSDYCFCTSSYDIYIMTIGCNWSFWTIPIFYVGMCRPKTIWLMIYVGSEGDHSL